MCYHHNIDTTYIRKLDTSKCFQHNTGVLSLHFWMKIKFYFIENYIHVVIFNNFQMISVFSIVIIPFRIHIHHMIHQITDSIGYLPFARANATERYRSVSLLVFRQYQIKIKNWRWE